MRPLSRSVNAARSGILMFIMLFTISACSSSSGATPQPSADGSASSTAPGASVATATPQVATATPQHAEIAVGVGLPIFSFAPVYIADAKGFWKDENLDVKLTFFNSGSEAQQALLGDAIKIGVGGYTEPMTVSAAGKPTVIFGFVEAALPYVLATTPEITDVSQLVGKVFGVSKIGALSDQLTRITLTKLGVDPSKVTYQQAGSASARLAALEAGAIDATLLSSPANTIAQKEGMTILANVADLLPGFAYEVLYAKKDTIEANHDVFLRFMRGYIRGAQYATDPANEDEVLQIVGKVTELNAEDVKLAYDDTIKDFPPTGELQLDGIQKALEGTLNFGDVAGLDKVTAEDLYYPDLQAEAAASLR